MEKNDNPDLATAETTAKPKKKKKKAAKEEPAIDEKRQF
jgi:hypothetical protein